MPSVHVASNPKFTSALGKALDDKVVSKLEARKLRRIAIADVTSSTKPAALAAHYSDQFTALEKKSADKPTERYLATVGTEFTERANAANAGVALRRYLTVHAAKLPALLKNVDVADKSGFVVGTSMNRGVWLQIPVKDRAQYTDTTEAITKLFASEPSLKKFGALWIV